MASEEDKKRELEKLLGIKLNLDSPTYTPGGQFMPTQFTPSSTTGGSENYVPGNTAAKVGKLFISFIWLVGPILQARKPIVGFGGPGGKIGTIQHH